MMRLLLLPLLSLLLPLPLCAGAAGAAAAPPPVDFAALQSACEPAPDVLAQCSELLAASDLAAAAGFAAQAVDAMPRCIDAFQCLGAVRYTQGDLPAAMAAFGAALDLNPYSAVVRANLALARLHAGYVHGAAEEYRKALELDPGFLAAGLMLAEALDSSGDADAAADLRETMLAQLDGAARAGSPVSVEDVTSLRVALAKSYSSSGRLADASQLLLDGVAADPGLWLRYALSHVPPIPTSMRAIAASRAATEALVADVTAALRNGSLVLARHDRHDSLEQLVDPGYYLTYHGVNDEPLRRAIGVMYACAFPALLHVAPTLARPALHPAALGFSSAAALRAAAAAAVAEPPALPRKLRVGFVSAFMHQHSVSKMIQRLITGLPRTLFHVTVFWFPGPEDYVVTALRSQVDAWVALPLAATLAAVQRSHAIIGGAALDVLVYPEIGMHRATYLLAHARLAPVQVSTHGNSETSGLGDSIDYFVSFDEIEDTHGDSHYSEQLLRMEGFHSQFTPPMHLPEPFFDRTTPHAAVPATPNAAVPATPPASVRSLSHTDAADDHLAAGPLSGVTSAFQLLAKHTPAAHGAACPPFVATVADDAAGTVPQSPFHTAACPNSTLYLAPQTLYKLHPSFDRVLSAVLRRDPCGTVMLLEGSSEAWDEQVVRRLAGRVAADWGYGAVATSSWVFDLDTPRPAADAADDPGASCDALTVLARLQPVLSRVVFGPQRGHNSWLRLLAAADVIVDSYPFGGCTSTYEALLMGTPVVSYPSDALRGRFTLALLRRAQLDQFLAASLDDLSRLAVSVGTFMSGQSQREKRLTQADLARQTRAHTLMDDTAGQRWTSFLLKAVAQHWRQVADSAA